MIVRFVKYEATDCLICVLSINLGGVLSFDKLGSRKNEGHLFKMWLKTGRYC